MLAPPFAIPPGGEDAARAFYGRVLGLVERGKPEQLRASGGVWFEGEGLQLHVGIEEAFAPTRKAHIALIVRDLPGLGDALRAAGSPFEADDRVPGRSRAYTADPFGNRIDPFTAQKDFHPGIDISTPIGTKVQAPADGIVISTGPLMTTPRPRSARSSSSA